MKKILIIIDMQKDFTNGVLGNAACEVVVKKIADLIEKENYYRVILTRDTHSDNYLQTQEGKKLPVPHCIKDTDGWQIREEIMQTLSRNYQNTSYMLIDKASFGSMSLGKILEMAYLNQQSDLEIDFCGVCTGICVISNVLIAKAALPEAKICVIEDACACVTPESHRTAIEAMKNCQVDII